VIARPSENRDAPALALSQISKQFGTVAALEDVSFNVGRGTVHALLGENGAGKTTLMRIAFGLIAPDTGTVVVPGARRRITSAADAIQAGLGMVHQHFTNVPEMTVAENVALGGHGRFAVEQARQRVLEIGARSGLMLDPSSRASQLPVSGQQRLEIVKALARDTSVLILDEPTAVLAPAESEELLGWLRRFADGGNAVVLITHKLHEALRIADDVTVLRHGRAVAHGAAAAFTADGLAAAMLGEDVSHAASAPTAAGNGRVAGDGGVVASAKGIVVLNERGLVAVRETTLEIRGGEIVGIAAIEGAGQRELLRALAGRIDVARGELQLPRSIGFVPEDRHRDALVLEFGLAENVELKGAGIRRGRLALRETRERTNALLEEFDVRGGGANSAARILSGGNQQKFVLAREMDGHPELLVVENPTRGLDIRASRAIHDRLRNAAAAGAGVVMYSSDLDEVLSLVTRVVVMHAGVARECARSREAVGRAMLGLTQ
jgi:simple sugar transport system ATP-binding protein